MRYVASYLLAALGGNSSPSAKDIKKILDSVGIEADDDRLNKVAPPLVPGLPDPGFTLLSETGAGG
jgi:large subunit ribosomal protein LP2